MKPVLMQHKNSKLSILVQSGQVETARLNGWYTVGDGSAKPPKVIKSENLKGDKNGKSTGK